MKASSWQVCSLVHKITSNLVQMDGLERSRVVQLNCQADTEWPTLYPVQIQALVRCLVAQVIFKGGRSLGSMAASTRAMCLRARTRAQIATAVQQVAEKKVALNKERHRCCNRRYYSCIILSLLIRPRKHAITKVSSRSRCTNSV